MTVNSYYLGSPIKAWTKFEQRTSLHSASPVWALYDPTGVKFRTTAPDGTQHVYVYGVDANVTKEATGWYVASFTPSTSSKWFYAWICDDGMSEYPVQVIPTH